MYTQPIITYSMYSPPKPHQTYINKKASFKYIFRKWYQGKKLGAQVIPIPFKPKGLPHIFL